VIIVKVKNWIVLLVFYIITILGVLYLCKIYSNSSSVVELSISDYTLNITDKKYDKVYDNVLNFSNEKDEFVIYVSSRDNSSFEKTFIDVINESNLKNKILFIDSDGLANFDYVNKLIDSLGGNTVISKKKLPIFIIIKDQKVSNVEFVDNFDKDSLKNILGGIYD